jgi:hypothetical protein
MSALSETNKQLARLYAKVHNVTTFKCMCTVRTGQPRPDCSCCNGTGTVEAILQ